MTMTTHDTFRLDFSDQMQRILVVDDDPQTLRIISHVLDKAGYTIWRGSNAMEALRLIERHGLPHLAIVDLCMPIMDGFDFCQKLHEFSTVPVIILTAKIDEETVIEALERHAEDYITKPFKPSELAARVQRVLRRMEDFDYTFDPLAQVDKHLMVNFPGRQAIVDGEVVPLTPIETKLLYILMRNGGRIVPIDSLLNRLWPYEPAQEDRLRVHVSRLRRKIELRASEPGYIVSERGTGYSFRPSPA